MLACEQVGLTLNEKVIFNQFDLMVPPGERVLVTGPSGSGKTTLLHLFLGFVLPDQGRVKVMGQYLTNRVIWQTRSMISYLDQDASLGQGSVHERLTALFNHKVVQPKSPTRQQWLDLFEHLSLEPAIWSQDLANLSGGERHRLALAVMMMMDRPIWLLDEPTATLDKNLRKKIVNFILAQTGKTMIVVSHDEIWEKQDRLRNVQLQFSPINLATGATHG